MARRPGWVVLVAGLGLAAAVRAADPPSPLAVRQMLPAAVVLGQGFSAEVEVTNTAGHPIDDVRLTGGWSAGYRLTSAIPPQGPGPDGAAEWPLGKLAPGERRAVKLTYSATDQNPGTEFRSTFEASFRGAKASVQTVPVQRPALDLSVTGPPVALVGQKVQVHVTLKNPGTGQVTGAKLSSRLPDGLSHPGGSDLEADVPVMQAGHTEAVPLELTPTKAGPVKACFKVAGPGLAPVEKEVSLVAVEGNLDLDLSGPKTLPQGWPGTYELTVRNAGGQVAALVQLEVAVPTGFDDQNLRATEGAKFDPAARKLVWTVGDLKPNETRTVIWLGVPGQPGEVTAGAMAKLSGVQAKAATWATRVQPAGK